MTEHNFIRENYSPEHFDTYGKAWSNIISIVDNRFFDPFNELTIGERVEASVVVATGLGIAFVTQYRREVNEFFGPHMIKAANELLKELPSLNLESLRDQVRVYENASSIEQMEDITYQIIFDKFGVQDELQKNLIKTVSAPVIDKFVEKIIYAFVHHKSRHGPVVGS